MSVCGLLIIAFIIIGLPSLAQNALEGAELKNFTAQDLKNKSITIVLHRSFPPRSSWASRNLEGYYSYGNESVYIFGDGVAFSERSITDEEVDNYVSSNFALDKTWINKKEWGQEYNGYFRRAKYNLTPDEVLHLIHLLGDYEGEMLPGDSIAEYNYNSEVRIIVDNREGRLFELTGSLIEDREKLKYIDSLIDQVRLLEWNSEIEVLGPLAWLQELESRKKEYGWFETRLEGRFFTNFKYAFDAYGVPYDPESGIPLVGINYSGSVW